MMHYYNELKWWSHSMTTNCWAGKRDGYTAKNAQPVTMLKTSLNNILLPILSLLVNNIVQAERWTILLTNRNNMASKILFKLVFINIVTCWASSKRTYSSSVICHWQINSIPCRLFDIFLHIFLTDSGNVNEFWNDQFGKLISAK
jgi:hypothetical protein